MPSWPHWCVSSRIERKRFPLTPKQASFIVQTTFWALSVRTGYGADYLKLNTYYRELFNKWWFLGSIFYLLTIALYKTSVILLLRRIFVQRGFQIVCWCMLVVNTCWGLGNLFRYDIPRLYPFIIIWNVNLIIPSSWTFECLPVEAMCTYINEQKGSSNHMATTWSLQ